MALAAAALLGLAAAAAVSLPTGRYLLRAGYEEARILLHRRPIPEVLADPATPASLTRVLALVSEVKSFAADTLGLTVGDTYRTYVDIGRDTLLLVVSASERYALRPYTWRYPIVGVVPYRGFFRARDAERLADRLRERGYDVYVRTAGAFSTLGWFEDPLLSTVVERDSMQVAATVIHELAHNTLYIPSATAFNESFANFVGYRGAERFFRSRGESDLAVRAVRAWAAERRTEAFFNDLAARLDSLYDSGADTAVLAQGRDAIFHAAREAVGRTEWELNNATVIAARLYRSGLDRFDAVYADAEDDIVRAVVAVTDRVRGAADPSAALSSP